MLNAFKQTRLIDQYFEATINLSFNPDSRSLGIRNVSPAGYRNFGISSNQKQNYLNAMKTANL